MQGNFVTKDVWPYNKMKEFIVHLDIPFECLKSKTLSISRFILAWEIEFDTKRKSLNLEALKYIGTISTIEREL